MKGKRVFSRLFDFVYFHLMSLVVGFTLIGPYDIVITPSPPLTIGIVGWLLGLRRNVPFVYNIQELYPDYAVNQGIITNPLLIALARRIERFVYTRSNKLVPISEGFSRTIQKRGIAKENICVIQNFVDIKNYPILSRVNSFSEKYGLIKSFVVYYGGNIGTSQDWNSLLYTAKSLSHLPIQFIITGDGVYEKWLEEQVKKENLLNVKLLGYQRKEIIPQIFASSDVCIIPMKTLATTDTFPSKIYAILASGKSVIAQADPDSDLWRLIKEARCGRVVPPGNPQLFADAIKQAYHERTELHLEGERGYRLVKERYSKEFAAKKYSELILELT
jgi:colanic acid biosynthesis glycosyl transferase WcaI